MNDAALRALLEPLLQGMGLELDHLDVVPAGRRSVLRVTVDGDGPKGRGPLLDDIAEATRTISEALDSSTAVGNNPYTLEVSSRGTSTPLVEPKHYRRNRGRLVKLVLTDGRSLLARIMATADDRITVEHTPEPTKQVKHPQPQTLEIALADIKKAVVQVELNRPFDPELDDEAGPDENDTTEADEPQTDEPQIEEN